MLQIFLCKFFLECNVVKLCFYYLTNSIEINLWIQCSGKYSNIANSDNYLTGILNIFLVVYVKKLKVIAYNFSLSILLHNLNLLIIRNTNRRRKISSRTLAKPNYIQLWLGTSSKRNAANSLVVKTLKT